MATTFKITLPLPPKCLQPNRSRKHWRTIADATKRSRSDAALVTKLTVSKQAWSHVYLEPVFYFRTRAKRDSHNLPAWLKSTIDGIADGLGIDDRRITLATPRDEVDPKDPRLEIVIREITITEE